MRWNRGPITFALAAVLCSAAVPLNAAGFGTVVPIGGHASDIALDEARGSLYISNFTANRIEVLSTADNSIRSSMNVAAQPGALAVTRNGEYLVIAHYGNWKDTDPFRNMVTAIRLSDQRRQTFVTGDAPLGLAALADNRILIVTAKGLMMYDPNSGVMRSIATFLELGSATLPMEQASFPAEIIETAVGASGDGRTVWGVGNAGSATQIIFRYDMVSGTVRAVSASSSTPLLPRVSVNQNGSQAMIGYAVFGSDFERGFVRAQFPDVVPSAAGITGHAINSSTSTIYAQIPTAGVAVPVLSILDQDNLTVRERLRIPENMIGRGLLTSNGNTLYAVSESGVIALPVGSLNQYARIAPSDQDVLAQSGYCDRRVITKSLTITDPGGGSTDFSISVTQPGVTVSPTSGVTPATVQIRVDPSAFQGRSGTTVVNLLISSNTAVNLPRPVRVLVSAPEPDQRGTIINVSGRLTDLLADSQRNRVYVLRQDGNELMVFEGSRFTKMKSLRTAATPTRMGFSLDRKFLIVGHDNAQLAYVYDLEALEKVAEIPLPRGRYLRAVAESNSAMLAVVRVAPGGSASGGTSACVACGEDTAPAVIERLDLDARTSTPLPNLGIWINELSSADSALASSPNGASILLAQPNGTVMLYSASADTFIASRSGLPGALGAVAASNYETYIVGDNILNKSLVPTGKLDASMGTSSGFAFINEGGFRATGSSSYGPGALQNFASLQDLTSVKPTRVAEAPVMPAAGMTFTRTIAPLAAGSTLVSLSTSGFTVLSWNYDAAVAPPKIDAVVNAADGTRPIAPGGLISIYGQQMSPVNMATSQIPLPTALGEFCVSINGSPVPLLFVSNQQINAQLPFNVSGNATLSVVTPGGISDNYYLTVNPAAPAIFRSGSAGPLSGLATVVRWNNGELVTPTNPVHPEDILTIYLTGMGGTSPQVETGAPAPFAPLAWVTTAPQLTLGGAPLEVTYSGLAPGLVGVYQINATVPPFVPQGLSIPLVINQGGGRTQLDVRVVK